MDVKKLHYSLGLHEYNRVMGCKNGKHTWDPFQVTNKETNEVKRFKRDLLLSKYKRFEIQPKETIYDMFTRFNY